MFSTMKNQNNLSFSSPTAVLYIVSLKGFPAIVHFHEVFGQERRPV